MDRDRDKDWNGKNFDRERGSGEDNRDHNWYIPLHDWAKGKETSSIDLEKFKH